MSVSAGGDALVFGGRSRKIVHGVDRIDPVDRPATLELPPLRRPVKRKRHGAEQFHDHTNFMKIKVDSNSMTDTTAVYRLNINLRQL